MNVKNQLDFFLQVNLENVMLNEVSQRRRNIVWYPLYVESKMKWYKWTYKTERDSQTESLGLPEGRERQKVRESRVHTAVFKMENE